MRLAFPGALADVDFRPLAAIFRPLPTPGGARTVRACALPVTRRETAENAEKAEKAMFAVIRTGGKQYKVAPDDVIKVERLEGEPGAELELGEVLAIGGTGTATTFGTPLVDGARVAATVLDQAKGDKIVIFKKKRRQGYHRTKGHRQLLTVLRIQQILKAGETRSAAPAEAKTPRARRKATEAAPVATPETAASASEENE